MERDFMGLSPKSTPMVKQEIPDDEEEFIGSSATAGESAMQWSFSNKDSLTGHRTNSSVEGFDSKNKSCGITQNISFDKPAGMTHHIVKTLPIANQTSAISMSVPVHQSILVSAGQHVASSTVSLQPIGGVQGITPVSVAPTTSPFAGTTELRNASKTSSGPAQLTIFYGGSVCVYNDVSLEKAQAIMLLAGNGTSSISPNTPILPVQVQGSLPKPPPSVNSHIIPQTTVRSTTTSSTNEKKGEKYVGPPLASPPPCTKLEPHNVVTPKQQHGPATMIQSAVPQFRKASLARFLEKRKERVMNASSPYMSKESSDCKAPISKGSLSMNSAAAAAATATAAYNRPLPAIN